MSINYEIDYKAEVLKVYPDAECMTAQKTANKAIYSFLYGGFLSDIADTEQEAWQNAFERLQQHSQTK